MASTIDFNGSTRAINPSSRKRGRDEHLPGPTPVRLPNPAIRVRSLSAVIENEIIPRLMVAHAGASPMAGPCVSKPIISDLEVENFLPLVLQVEADVLLRHVESILADGIAFDTVMVQLLAPTARLLGQLWEQDRCDFIDVTMGLWRLQEVVNEISGRYPAEQTHGGGGHRALFATMPEDQHSFGTVVVDELFRRHGWATDRLSDADKSELLKRAADCWFDVIGLTISCDRHIASLASVIAALRNVSRNPRVCVLVGGRVFSADPDLAVQVGADGTARDAELALKLAYDLLRAREGVVASVSLGHHGVRAGR